MVSVISARSPGQLDDFRTLVREFVDWGLKTLLPEGAEVPPVVAEVDQELARLPGKYAEPDGTILLAYADGQPAGCIAGFRRDASSMEMTRLWVRPTSRGNGAGNELVRHFLNAARQAGYRRAVLRSHKELKAAHRIYRKEGFSDMDGVGYFPGFEDVEIAMKLDLE